MTAPINLPKQQYNAFGYPVFSAPDEIAPTQGGLFGDFQDVKFNTWNGNTISGRGEAANPVWDRLGIKPPTEQQLAALRAEAAQTGGWVDHYGRLWNPGSTIQGEGGHYRYNPVTEQDKQDYYRTRLNGADLTDTVKNSQDEDINLQRWQWIPDGSTENPSVIDNGKVDFNALKNAKWRGASYDPLVKAGVYSPGPDRGTGWGKGLSTLAGAYGPMIGAGAFGPLMQTAGSLASVGQGGYNTYNAASNGNLVGALSSGVKTLSGLNNAAGNIDGMDLGGGNMGGYDLSNGVDYAGLDEVGGYIGSDNTPAMDPNIQFDGGGGYGFLDAPNWEKILPTAAGIGLGVYGQLSNNVAGAKGQQALNAAQQAQQAGANDALQLQREQFEYQKRLNEPFYNKGLQGFDQYASAVTGQPGANGKVWSPTESPAYQWQQQQAEKNNSRTLRALGRENSSYGMGEQFKSQQNLASSEYDKQLGRLADLTNIARGGASTLTGASSNYGTNAGNLAVTSGNNQANASLAGGLMQQNNLYNGQNQLMSLANLGLKAFGNNGNWTTGG